MDRKIQKNAWEQEDHSGAGNFVVKEDGEGRQFFGYNYHPVML